MGGIVDTVANVARSPVGQIMGGALLSPVLDQVQNATRGAPQVGGAVIDNSAFNPNAQEQSLTDMLVARANGTVPSAAEQQMQNGIGQAQRAASAQAASARGVNPALAARLAQQSQSNLATQGIGQTAALRSQEQAQATNAAASVLGDQRSGRGAAQQLNVQNVTGVNNLNSQNANASATRSANLLSGAGSAAMMASDERLKTDVHSGKASIQDFLDAISAEEYQYKDPGAHGEGTQVSPMAQDLEKTPLGDQMVMDTPQGKMVDYGKGMGAMLAAQAHLNDRLNKIEGTQKMSSGGWAGYTSGVDSAVRATAQAPQEQDKSGDFAASLMKKGMSMKAAGGAMVPGKAKVAGDDPSNDTVKALLSPGELVIPRTVVQAGPDAIRSFAEALLEEEKSA